MDLMRTLLYGYQPKSSTDAATRVFAELHKQASVRLVFREEWQGPRDTLKALASEYVEQLGICRGAVGAAIDNRGRRLLVIPITFGHVVIREAGDSSDRFRNWASPIAQGLEGVSRNAVNIGFVLFCISMNGWQPEAGMSA